MPENQSDIADHKTLALMKRGFKLFTGEYYSSFTEHLSQYIAVAKNRDIYKSKVAHLEFQLKILEVIEEIDQNVASGTKAFRESGDEDLEAQRLRNKTLASAYRSVADGIAWRSFDFSRFTHRILSQARSPGGAHNKLGREAEVQYAKTIVVDGRFALLHDVTNAFRVGDISILKQIPSTTPDVTEVKNKKDLITAARVARRLQNEEKITKQQSRLLQANLMIRTRQWHTNGKTINVDKVTPVNRDFMATVGAIFKQAERKGSFGKYVSEYMHVDALDFSVLSGYSPDQAKESLEKYDAPTDDLQALVTNYDTLSLLHGNEISRLSPPYTVFPFKTSVIAKIITGQMLTRTFLVKSKLIAAFDKYGYSLIFDEAALDRNLATKTPEYHIEALSAEEIFPEGYGLEPWIFLRHKESGFKHPAGEFLATMAYEYTSVEAIVSLVDDARRKTVIGVPRTSFMDIRDSFRWQ